jgi:hypothetical protein
MRLSGIDGFPRSFLVYKWMAGDNWNVWTTEGTKSVGDMIIPKWVGMSMDVMPMFFSLVFNNADYQDTIYLATIRCTIDDPDAVTDKEYETFEYGTSELRLVGVPAYQLGEEESLILAPCRLEDLFEAVPDENFSRVLLIGRDGSSTSIDI